MSEDVVLTHLCGIHGVCITLFEGCQANPSIVPFCNNTPQSMLGTLLEKKESARTYRSFFAAFMILYES